MKKIFYFYMCFGLLAVLAVSACTAEFDGRDSKGEAGHAGELTVIEAQAYFEDYAADFTLAGFKSAKTRGDTEPVITPLWDQSRSFTIDGVPMVEVPLNVLPSYSYRARDSVAVAAMTDKAPNTMIYLLAQKDADGDVTYRVAHIVADSAYLAGDPAKAVEDLSVSKLSDFSGMVVYYDVTGTLLDGVVYQGGREVAIIVPVGSSPSGSAAVATRANVDCEVFHFWFEIPWNVTWGDYDGEDIVVPGKNIHRITISVCGLDGSGDEEPDEPDKSDPDPNHGNGNNTKPEILDNSKLTAEQKKKLEAMLKKIKENCMGGMLHSELVRMMNGEKYKIEFDPNIGASEIDYFANKITLGTKGTDSEALFHELFHLYLYYIRELNLDFNRSELNREIEIFCAMYMYASKQDGFEPGVDWYDIYEVPGAWRESKKLATSLNSKGQYYNLDDTKGQIDKVKEALRKMKSYRGRSFDTTRSTGDNLRNIRALAKNC